MSYSNDRTELQNYLSTGSTILDPNSDLVIILYKVLLQITDILVDINSVKVSTTNIDITKATSLNQTTTNNRLLVISDHLEAIKNSITALDTNSQDLLTEIQTGLIKQVVENILLELQTGDLKLNSDEIVQKLIDVVASLVNIENKLYGLHPTDGINGAILQLLTDIRNKLVVELVERPTEIKIVLTDQIMVSNPVIKNINLSTPNVEYSVVLPAGTRRFSIKSRLDIDDGNGIIRYSYVQGIVANATDIGEDSYYTVGQYVEDSEENLVLSSPLAVYFSSNTPNVVVTVKYWGAAPLLVSNPRSTPHLKTIFLNSADTQYTFQLPIETKKYTIKCRDNNNDNSGIIRAAYVSGLVAEGLNVNGNSYTTIQPGNELQEFNVLLSDYLNIYLASSTSNLPVTVEYWT